MLIQITEEDLNKAIEQRNTYDICSVCIFTQALKRILKIDNIRTAQGSTIDIYFPKHQTFKFINEDLRELMNDFDSISPYKGTYDHIRKLLPFDIKLNIEEHLAKNGIEYGNPNKTN